MQENCFPDYFIKHFFHMRYDRECLTEKHTKVIIHTKVYYIYAPQSHTQVLVMSKRNDYITQDFPESSLYPQAMKLSCQMLSEGKSTVQKS